MLPAWARRDPAKYVKRIRWEKECLGKYFPSFEMMQEDDGDIFLEGNIVTLNENVYKVKVYFPDNYPYSPPIPVVMDIDVIAHCKKFDIHEYHYYEDKSIDGLRICVIKPDDTIGTGWKPDFSSISVILLASAWLHAFEVKKETGIWPLPEA